jgi:hypothetical protein
MSEQELLDAGLWWKARTLRGVFGTLWRHRSLREKHLQHFEALRKIVHAMRAAVKPSPDEALWTHLCRRFGNALRRLDDAHVAPLAAMGKKFDDGLRSRKGDEDREDFLRLARKALKRKPGLSQSELLTEWQIVPYVREHPDQVLRWCRELYPGRPVGRPRKK